MSMTLADHKAYAEDFIKDTRGLSLGAVGLYYSLTMQMYHEKKPIEENYTFLSVLGGGSKYAIRKLLAELIRRKKITRVKDGLWNPQLDEELGEIQ